ncbi:MAG: archease [Vicinamibacteria bacterium]
MWEHFPHDADMGVRGIGKTKDEAFAEAARALSALTTVLDEVSAKERIEISGSASSDDELLVEWLDAVVFEMETRLMVFTRFDVRIENGTLRGAAWGEKRDPDRHTAGVEVKGPTFTALHVGLRDDGLWVAQCIVDV